MSKPTKSYFQLAKEAIVALKDRSGSSTQAIKAWIVKNYPTVAFANVSAYTFLISNAKAI